MAETNVAIDPTVKVPEPTQTPVESTPSQSTTVTEPTTAATSVPTGDILSRVTKKKEIPVVKEPTQEEAGQTFKEFESITDPTLKAEAIRKYKEVQSWATKTNQEKIALQKQFEDFQRNSQNWTPERIQNELLKNPQFLQAAQQVTAVQNPAGSGLTDEQFSALTLTEKNQLLTMNQQIGELRQQNFISALNQRDALLQTKYGDYDALKINQGIQDLARMNPIDIREHAYRAIFHDEHVKHAYELGLEEGKGINQERKQAVTISSNGHAMPASEVPKKEKGENDINYFARLAQRRLDQAKGLQAAKR